MRAAVYSLLVHALLASAAWYALRESARSALPRLGDPVALEWGHAPGATRAASVSRAVPPAPPAAPMPPASAPIREPAPPETFGLRPAEAFEAAPAPGAAGTGPSAPGSAARDAGIRSYALTVRARIESRLRYPLALRRRGITGTVRLALAIQPSDGALLEAEVVQSSGSRDLDALAVDAARGAAPFGNAGVTEEAPLRFPLSLEFRVK